MKHNDAVRVEPRLLTVREAARYTCQTVSGFRTMIRRGQIPEHCIFRLPGRSGTNPKTGKPFPGRKVMIEKAELDRFLDSLRAKPESA